MRKVAVLAGFIGVLGAGSPASAQVAEGPYADTAISQGGRLIWYTGVIDVRGRTWRDLDALCATVNVSEVSGWRAPTEREVRTLFVEVPRSNAVTTWTEIHLANAQALTPAIPIFVAMGPNGVHPHMNIVLRDLYTYEGRPTTLARVERGHMYVVRWFNRWTKPFLTRDQTITHTPGNQRLGRAEKLLCVADR